VDTDQTESRKTHNLPARAFWSLGGTTATHPDIAVANSFATNVGVLLNAGNGMCGAQTYPVGYEGISVLLSQCTYLQ
jgi:hypothetical protein